MSFTELIQNKQGSRDFIYSSKRENKELGLKKIYIIQPIWDGSIGSTEPPFSLQREGYVIENPVKIVIPALRKEMMVYDNKEQRIYTNADLSIIDNYASDLNKIERILFDILTSIDKIEFYMLDNLLNGLDKIRYILTEYEGSIRHFNNTEIRNTHENVKNVMSNLETTIMTRASYLDMRTGRILTIVTIIFFPALFVAGWMGMNFSKKQMRFLNWEYSYITTLVVISIFITLMAYSYRRELF